MILQDNITPTPPSNNVSIRINGVLDQTITSFVTVDSSTSQSAWFNLDMSTIGQRNTIQYFTTMTVSGYEIINEFQLELNYVY